MFLSRFSRQFIASVILTIATALPLVPARAESIFDPYKERIREQIPVGLSLHLPEKILLNPSQQDTIENFTIRVFVSQDPARLTLSLYSCQSGPTSCLLGSFLTERHDNVDAQRKLQQHQNMGLRITLKNDVAGYVFDNAEQQSGIPFGTMMWEQDNMIHTLSFPQEERQNMLYMALSMANSVPLFRP